MSTDGRLYMLYAVSSFASNLLSQVGPIVLSDACAMQGQDCVGFYLVELQPGTLTVINAILITTETSRDLPSHIACGETSGNVVVITGGTQSTVFTFSNFTLTLELSWLDISFTSVGFAPGTQDQLLLSGLGRADQLLGSGCYNCTDVYFYGSFDLGSSEAAWQETFAITSSVGPPRFSEPAVEGAVWVLNNVVTGDISSTVTFTMDRVDESSGGVLDQILFSSSGGVANYEPIFAAQRAFIDPTGDNMGVLAVYELSGETNTVGNSCPVGSGQAVSLTTAAMFYTAPTNPPPPPVVFEDITCGGKYPCLAISCLS